MSPDIAAFLFAYLVLGGIFSFPFCGLPNNPDPKHVRYLIGVYLIWPLVFLTFLVVSLFKGLKWLVSDLWPAKEINFKEATYRESAKEESK